MKNLVLIVDDEKELALILKDFLEKEGIETIVAFNGADSKKALDTYKPSLVILDIMLPDDDGMEICRKIRSNSDMPIIMLSAKDSDIDQILSLGLGADEYLTKPYSPAVVVAHVKALLRRYRLAKTVTMDHIIELDGFMMDSKKHIVQVHGRSVDLVSKEFEILWYLASHPGEVYTKEVLYDAIWGEDEFGEISTVTVHVRKIREKIESDPSKPEFLKTIWGVGYKFELS
ncbi:MAG: response regulator transcription factor [Vallitaleaceae bacterium]|jgi:two-component system response regulator VicR|nr:response regulator transcription factor [Vallitaleaceae bacterium]